MDNAKENVIFHILFLLFYVFTESKVGKADMPSGHGIGHRKLAFGVIIDKGIEAGALHIGGKDYLGF